ncbi:MAG TPA: hypothetical protein VMQ86_09190 [Bryobacteraceae bacterium]|jgi:hypothetical protein|nr:hypothetical protein [Bryobacteraceae bacterium]
MEPMRQETKTAILNANPQAEPEIDEYERLLAERFTIDPDAPATQPLEATARVHQSREQRLQELHRKLFAVVHHR